jgi:O-antigen/teichoic acid export membrane protein
MVLAKLLERGLGVVSTLILARLLVPEDFGLIAMATSVLALLELFAAFGFDIALIRDQEATRAHYDTAWTLNVLLGVVIGLGLVVLCWPASWFYNEPRLVPVMAVMSLAAIVQGFENIGVVAFRKELDFRREFLFVGGKKLVMFCTTIPLAVLWESYWALVAGSVAGRFAGTALSYAVHSYRPRFSMGRWHDLFAFSKWLLLMNLINFVRTRLADFVIGRVAGPKDLGLYTVGAEIALMPTTELVAPINRAVFPAYAKIAGDGNALRREYLAVIGMIATLGLPAAFGVAAVAPLAVPVLLGERWVSAVKVVEILAWVGALRVLLANSNSVFLAINKPHVQAALSALHAGLLAVLLPVMGASTGLQGVLAGSLIAAVVAFPPSVGVLLRELQLKLGQLGKVLWRPLTASAAMYGAVSTYATTVDGSASIPALVIAVALGGACYTLLVVALWRLSGRPGGAEAAILSELSGRFKAMRAPPG